MKDAIIELEYHHEDTNGVRTLKVIMKLLLRILRHQDEQNRYFEFLTNHFDLGAEEVAFLYKKRLGIEILFKKMKQNFQLRYFMEKTKIHL